MAQAFKRQSSSAGSADAPPDRPKDAAAGSATFTVRVSRDEPIYTISIAARLVRPVRSGAPDAERPLHAQTLRTYEREGLVKPKRVGRNRLYSERDIERLQQIQHLTQERGVNLAGVEIILDLMERIRALENEIIASRGG